MTELNGKASNPKDPLWKNAPERAQHLTNAFAKVAHQFSTQDVINAAAGIMVTAFRQAYATKQEAELRYDEVYGRMKSILLGHYDSISGRQKGVFPYDQTISPQLISNKNNFPN